MKKLLCITLATLAVAFASAQAKPVPFEDVGDNQTPANQKAGSSSSAMESLGDFMGAIRGNPTSPLPVLVPSVPSGTGSGNAATKTAPTSWSAPGPQGSRGQQGNSGPQGSRGPTGRPGKTFIINQPLTPSYLDKLVRELQSRGFDKDGHGALWTPMLQGSGVLATAGVSALIDKKLAGYQPATTAPTGARTPGGEKKNMYTSTWDPITVMWVVGLLILAVAIGHWLWGNHVHNRGLHDVNRQPSSAFDPHDEVPGWFKTNTTKHGSTLEAKGEAVMIAEATAKAEIAHCQALAVAARTEERRAEREAMLAARLQAANQPPMLVPVYAIAGNAATPPTPAPAPTPEPGRLTVAEIGQMQRLFGAPAAQPVARPNRAGGGNAGAAAAPAPATP